MFRVFLVVSALAVLACGSSSIKLHQLESVAEVERLAHRSFKTFINFLGDALQGKNTETLFLESAEAMDITQVGGLARGSIGLSVILKRRQRLFMKAEY